MKSQTAAPPLIDKPSAHVPTNRAARRVPRSTIALLFVSIILPLLLFTLAAMQNRHDVERAAELRVERTTRILHEHALKVFETHQLMIDQINERLRTLDWSNDRQVRSLRNLLTHLQALLPQVAAVTITDANGEIRVGSLAQSGNSVIGYADRDWFKALKAADQPLPYISRTVTGRQSGKSVFNMAARISGPVPGRFDGVISISIDQRYFRDFYRDAEREYQHLTLLVREDGSVLVSDPEISTAMLPSNTLFRLALESRSNGFLIQPSVLDGTKRIFGYEKVGAYPVVIGFGITWDSALAPWWRNMWAYGLVAVLSSLALLGVSGFAIRRIALEGRATGRWRRSAAQLESEMAERAKVEEQLRQSQKMEAVGRLTGGIAHDFNNLLTVVIGSLDLLSRRMKDADPRQQALVKNAVDGASRAATLTARLLAFSRQHPLDPAPIDANALINDVSNLLQRTLGEPVSTDFVLAAGLWQTFADPNQLENAILNLCVNAADAMPKGGTLTIETANVVLDDQFCGSHPGVLPGPYVMVCVADTGTGMPPEVVARAFEPFFTTKPTGKGTGLGLSQVYGFARQSGGHALIETRPEQGTKVKIYLPRLKAKQTPKAVPSAPSSTPGAAVPAGRIVLIVEDNDLVREFSSAALREAGYVVVEAATGPAGIEHLESDPNIALLFTDVVLKGPMDGRELAEHAVAARPDLPVLFTTGYTKDAITYEGRSGERGELNFIAKPFTTAALAAKIAELLQEKPVAARRTAVG